MNFKILFKSLGSIRLSIIWLGMAMVLVFLSTLQRVHLGIHEVQARYFAQWLAWLPLPCPVDAPIWLQSIRIPVLGGYGLGLALGVNLIASIPRVLKPNKIGLLGVHIGLIILIISGFVSAYYQEETQMWLQPGTRSFYSESTYDNELVLIDESEPLIDTVYAIDTQHLRPEIDDLPFKIRVIAFYSNAHIVPLAQNPQAPPSLATTGIGLNMGLTVIPTKPTYQENERNAQTAYIQILSLDGEDLGVFLVSNILDERFPKQGFTYQNRYYSIALRFKRDYLPFSLQLVEFMHEKHPGTQIPKAFKSVVDVYEPNQSAYRVAIKMNEPLRVQGYTLYQASFSADDQASMLQVVKNPGYYGPYIGVVCIALALFGHFAGSLILFLRKNI